MFPRKTICMSAAVTALCWVVGLSGCERRPQAPVLRDSPVYRNQAEGLRFLVPAGWKQTASTQLPEGLLESQAFLVRYRVNSPEPGAILQIECAPDRAEVDLVQHHSAPSYRVERWTADEKPQDLTIGGAAAQRLVFSGEIAGRKMTKEVVCFRRNGRIYSFVGLFWSNDDKAREQIRRAVESTIWDR